MREDEISFVIPVFGMDEDRLKNCRFVVKKICEVSNAVLVVEQVRSEEEIGSSSYKKVAEDYGASYLPVVVDDPNIHKSLLINTGARACNTKFVWVNDADCYLKFDKALSNMKLRSPFIQPYIRARKLTPEQTSSIVEGRPTKVEYEDSGYIKHSTSNGPFGQVSLYSALSFVFDKETFFDIGGMDEDYVGWGLEDTDLCYRVLIDDRWRLQVEENKAVHLYHGREENYKKTGLDTNAPIIETKFGLRRRDIGVTIKEKYRLLDKKIGIVGIGRTGTSCLAMATRHSCDVKYCGEPFGSWGVHKKPENPYRYLLEESEDLYIDTVLENEVMIKHLDFEVLRLGAWTGPSKSFTERATLKMVQDRDILIFTTRSNFIDWMVSQVVSGREEAFICSEYSGKSWEIDKEEFDKLYDIWKDWHTRRLKELISERKKTGKPYYVVDYYQISDEKWLKEFIVNNIPAASPRRFYVRLKKQKTKPNKTYISNYEEVLAWAKEAGIEARSKDDSKWQ